MANIAEFHSQLAKFPTPRIRNVCRPDSQGSGRCKYLSGPDPETGILDSDYRCERATLMGRQIDNHQRHEGFEGDGNCSGILGFIIENQEDLRGRVMVHHEKGEDTPGVFSGIVIDNGIISVGSIVAPEPLIKVEVGTSGIVFSRFDTPDIKETVFFENPEETAE